ncbi:MAG TPA: hypothetical protein VFP72_01965 [Kineosporiaceae bacterium]|nr:hypothetical protein [Kineosporiaceae bacterium]
MGIRNRTVMVAAALVAAVGLGGYLVWSGNGGGAGTRGEQMQAQGQPTAGASGAATTVTGGQLAAVARTRVFFGHQSVGMNLIEAIPKVYAEHGVSAPAIAQDTAPEGSAGFVHAFIGENTRPETKLAAFDSALRGGMAGKVDVAFMKFCYVDVTAGTDVDALFAKYRDTLAALQRDYPKVRFLHVTVPLTTIRSQSGLRATVKRVLGRGDGDVADDAARERLNTLIRKEFPADRVFDLAAVESTTPDGGRVSGTLDGKDVYALYDGYTGDGGHLNDLGADRAAAGLLATIAGR